MWLFVPFLFLLLLAIIGGLLVGGIYAAVLIPVVAIILLGIAAALLLRKSRGGRRSRPAGSVGPPSQADSAADRETAPDSAMRDDSLDAARGGS
jgi:predicted lipid-binding transport protein (Tim44 family)